jgi:arylsulfatase A-like enzyme/predicted Zn-dependent protease
LFDTCRNGFSRVTAASLLPAVALLVGCDSASSRDPAEFSVVVVTLDTTRADRIGAYGGASVPTPHIDAIAEEGVLFESAYAQAPLTLPSHSSMFTGKYPASHGVRHNGVFRLRAEETTLAERLKDAGFATAAVVGAFVLNAGYGTEQGFDVYSDIPRDRYSGGRDQLYEAQRPAEEVNREVFRWLEEKPEGRFFLWVHYYDPHAPYAPPETSGRELHGSGYDREISYMDSCFGDLIARLRREGILDDVLLIVAGDHGESLGHHGELSHGVFLYEPAMRVPMIFRAPGLVPKGRRVPDLVELVDVAPTVLDLLGLPPLPGASGRSLAPLLRGEGVPEGRVVFAETFMPRIEFGWSELRMVRDRRFKYIQAPRPELYDLREDPAESVNLHGLEPERSAEMASVLANWVASTTDADVAADARRSIGPEEEAKLRSLGYLGGNTDPNLAEHVGALPDPKDHVAEGAIVLEARKALEAGNVDFALASLNRVLEKSPGNHLARSSKIQALIKLKRFQEAEDEAWGALAAASNDASTSANLVEKARRILASVLWLNGKNREAEEQYRLAILLNRENQSAPVFPGILLGTASGVAEAQRIVADVLERNPNDPAAWAARFELQASQGAKADALKSAKRLAELEAGDPDTLVRAGSLARDSGDLSLAVRLFEIAHEKAPSSPDILGYLGTARLTAGDIAGAERDLLRVRSLRPEDPRAPFFLANVALLRNEEDKAKKLIDEALRADPDFLPPLLNYARWLAEKGRMREAIAVTQSALERRPGDPNADALLRKLREAASSGRS